MAALICWPILLADFFGCCESGDLSRRRPRDHLSCVYISSFGRLFVRQGNQSSVRFR